MQQKVRKVKRFNMQEINWVQEYSEYVTVEYTILKLLWLFMIPSISTEWMNCNVRGNSVWIIQLWIHILFANSTMNKNLYSYYAINISFLIGYTAILHIFLACAFLIFGHFVFLLSKFLLSACLSHQLTPSVSVSLPRSFSLSPLPVPLTLFSFSARFMQWCNQLNDTLLFGCSP